MSVPSSVVDRLRAALGLGEPDARAGVTFLGAGRVDVLRFRQPADRPGRDAALVHYAALGAASLLLTVRADGRVPTDGVVRQLAVVAASPEVEGVRLAPGGAVELGRPLWPGAPFTAVLLAEGPAPDAPVLRLLPMTPAEAAWRRAHDSGALRELWRRHGTDLHDPTRAAVPLPPLTG